MTPVLWPHLIETWGIRQYEVDYINRQQGLRCQSCNSSLRSMALAQAMMDSFGFKGLFRDFVRSWRVRFLRILEVNEAGSLTKFLRKLRRHQLVKYPEVDMQQMPFADGSFDVVIHSDTLEHIPDPVAGLKECHRVLRKNGRCLFTTPVVVERLTRSREGLPPSFHGSPKHPEDCRVFTEYGADAWKHPAKAGFSEITLSILEYPAAIAFRCKK